MKKSIADFVDEDSYNKTMEMLERDKKMFYDVDYNWRAVEDYQNKNGILPLHHKILLEPQTLINN